MDQFEKENIVTHIESIYGSFTPVEKNIAKFFFTGPDIMDLSSKSVANRLYVSESSLSRFAKKCGFHGYREFIFLYEQNRPAARFRDSKQSNTVLNLYQAILSKSYSLIDEGQMRRIAELFLEKKRVYVYGKGSSAAAGYEMKIRFLQIGIGVELVSDLHLMKMNYLILDSSCLAVGITNSGRSEIYEALAAAKSRGASTVLFTSRLSAPSTESIDEVMLYPVKENIDNDNIISPMFPVLVMMDILFSYIMESDAFNRNRIRESAFKAVNG